MKLDRQLDTICAISTPIGPGGIGIIRMSGPQSLPILKAIFKPVNKDCRFESHRLYYGFIIDNTTNQVVDEALCVYMKAPRSYTKEDVVEIQCHSGPAILNRILRLCMDNGARLAEPGEFTKRAYLNGRIDLSQAEAVIDMINAQAEGLGMLAVSAITGQLAKKIGELKDELLFCLSALEVAIDYPEDQEEIVHQEELGQRLEKVIDGLEQLIRAYDHSKIQRYGVRILLIGRPNAGKSSLLNALSCEERAIVTDIPGTTRDVVEKQLDIKGIPVTLTDTAGIRNAPDVIERMGIEKIKDYASEAYLFLWLLDLDSGFDDEDLAVLEFVKKYPKVKLILVMNKVDKVKEPRELTEEIRKRIIELDPNMASVPVVPISAKKAKGLDKLIDEIARALESEEKPDELTIAPNFRQSQILQKVLFSTKNALDGLEQGLSAELLALDLRAALDHLGEITGETATEDILNEIFSNFCLGK